MPEPRKPDVVEVTLTLTIHDPDRVLRYARDHAAAWGFDADTFAGSDFATLSLAAAELVLLHAPDPPLADLGVDILAQSPALTPAWKTAVTLLERLYAWGREMGGWEAPVWRDLEEFLGVAAPEESADA